MVNATVHDRTVACGTKSRNRIMSTGVAYGALGMAGHPQPGSAWSGSRGKPFIGVLSGQSPGPPGLRSSLSEQGVALSKGLQLRP